MTFNGKQSPGLHRKVSKMGTRSYRDYPVTRVDGSGLCFREFVCAWLSLSINTVKLISANMASRNSMPGRFGLFQQFADVSLPSGSLRDIYGNSCNRRSNVLSVLKGACQVPSGGVLSPSGV